MVSELSGPQGVDFWNPLLRRISFDPQTLRLIDRIVDAEGVPAARTLDPFGLGTAEPRLVVAVLGLTFWAGDDQPDLLADNNNDNS